MTPITIWLTDQQTEYLDQLVKHGLWGPDRTQAAEQLVMQGFQRGAESGFIGLRGGQQDDIDPTGDVDGRGRNDPQGL